MTTCSKNERGKFFPPTTSMDFHPGQTEDASRRSVPEGSNAAKEQYLTTQVRLDEAVVHAQKTVGGESDDVTQPVTVLLS